MTCINYSSNEYKTLQNESGLSKLLLDSRILAYRRETNSPDAFPDSKWVNAYTAKQPGKYTNYEFLTSTLSMVDDFLNTIGVETQIFDEIYDTKGNVITDVHSVANLMEGIIEIRDANRVEEWHRVPREAAYFFTELLRNKGESALYDDLVNQAVSDGFVEQVVNELNGAQYYNEEAVYTEAITRMINEALITHDLPKNILQRLFDWIKSLIGTFSSVKPADVAAMQILESDISNLLDLDSYKELMRQTYLEDVVYPDGMYDESHNGMVGSMKNYVGSVINQTDLYYDYIINKEYRKRTKYLTKTLNNTVTRYESSTEAQLHTIVGDLQNKIQPQLDGVETRLYPKFAFNRLMRDVTPPNLEDVIPTLRSLPTLQKKFQKQPIALNSPIKLDGVKQDELEILNNVRELIKNENPTLKSLPAEPFINEVYQYLKTNYLLSFKTYNNVASHNTYRVVNTFENPNNVTHDKTAVWFNNKRYLYGGHFGEGASAWINLTKYDNGVLLHEIQSDNIEDLRKFADALNIENVNINGLVDVINQTEEDIQQKAKDSKPISWRSAGEAIFTGTVLEHIKKDYVARTILSNPNIKPIGLRMELDEQIQRVKNSIESIPTRIENAKKQVDKTYKVLSILRDLKNRGGISYLFGELERLDGGEYVLKPNRKVPVSTMNPDGFFNTNAKGGTPQLLLSGERAQLRTHTINNIRKAIALNYDVSESQLQDYDLFHSVPILTFKGIPGAVKEFIVEYETALMYGREFEYNHGIGTYTLGVNNRDGKPFTYRNSDGVTKEVSFNDIVKMLAPNSKFNPENPFRDIDKVLSNRILDGMIKNTQKSLNSFNEALSLLYKQQSGKTARLNRLNRLVKFSDKQLQGIIDNVIHNRELLLQSSKNLADSRTEQETGNGPIEVPQNVLSTITQLRDAVNKNIELSKNLPEIPKDILRHTRIEKNYITPLLHHGLQSHIKQYGKDTPLYFTGYEATRLTQGSIVPAKLYGGPEEVSRGLAPSVGTVWLALSKLPGVKLHYLEAVPGLLPVDGRKPTGGYLVDLTNYDYEQPLLFAPKRNDVPVTQSGRSDISDSNVLLDEIVSSGHPMYKSVAERLKMALNRSKITIPVVYYNGGNDPELNKHFPNGIGRDLTNRPGFYDPETNTIYMNSQYDGQDSTGLHELLHPMTVAAVNANPEVAREFTEMLESVRTALGRKYGETWQSLASQEEVFYGLKNVQEFVSEIFSNGNFINELKSLQDKGKRNILQRIADLISRVFARMFKSDTYRQSVVGMQDRILSILLEYTDKITAIQDGEILPGRMPKDFVSDTQAFKDFYKQQESKINFIPLSHTYVNDSGREWMSVSKLQETQGFYDPTESTAPGDLKQTLNQAVGKGVHTEMARIVTGESPQDAFDFNITSQAKKQLKSILDDLLPEGTEILGCESRISTDNPDVAGTVDLVVKTPSGVIRIIDLKTKITKTPNFEKNNWRYYTQSDRYVPDRDKHNFQLTTYKTIHELNSYKIDEIGIVPLEIELIQEPGVEGYTISNVAVTKQLGVQDNADGAGFYKLRPNVEITRKVYNALDVTFSDSDAVTQAGLDKLASIVENGRKALGKRAQLMSYRGESESKARRLAEVIDEMTEMDNQTAVIEIVNAAINQMRPLYIQYQGAIAKEKASGKYDWNFGDLKRWAEFAESFGVLDEIQLMVEEYPELFDGVEGFNYNDFLGSINDALRYKKVLGSLYDEKLHNVWLDKISQYSTVVEARHKLAAEMAYKRKWKRDHGDSNEEFDKTDMKRSIAEYMSVNERRIQIEKKQFIDNMSKQTSQDTNFVYRWAQTIFDSHDPIIGAMAKMYHEMVMAKRDIEVDWFTDMIQLQKDFEAASGLKTGGDDQKAYDFMLDYSNDGVSIVSETPRKFTQEYTTFKKALYSDRTLTSQQKAEKREDWLAKNAPLITKDYDGLALAKVEIRDMYKKYYKDGVMDEDTYEMLLENESLENPKSLYRLAKDGDITDDLADLLQPERASILWGHRQINKTRYPNPKYDALMKLPEDNIYRRYWEFMRTTMKNGDSAVDGRWRLNGRLPGISKVTSERIKSEGLISALNNAKKENIIDPFTNAGYGRNNTDAPVYVMATETNEQIRYVPVHFTKPLTVKDQSFDIPTIMKEWYFSTLNYKHVTDILPVIEYTQRVINNRDVIKKNRFGSTVKNALNKAYNDRHPDKSIGEDFVKSTNNYLAEQLNDWINQEIYQQRTSLDPRATKIASVISRFTSARVMALNIYSMVNNATMGEVNQAIEVLSGSIMSPSAYTKASKVYLNDTPAILGDIGNRETTSKVNLMNDKFGLFQEMTDGRVRDRNKASRLAKESTLYFTTNIGEHILQSRFLIGTLLSAKALDADGNELGTVWDMFEVVDGKLKQNPKFDKWIPYDEINPISWDTSSLNRISRKVTTTSRLLHGNYGKHTANALQSNGYANMLQTFRKWVIPGIQRRWSGRKGMEYFEFDEEFRQGYYWAGGRHVKDTANLKFNQVMGFFGKLTDEARMLDLMVKTDWDLMSEPQKQAIRRFYVDLGVYGGLSILLFLLSFIDDDDEDKNKKRSENYVFSGEWWYNHMVYQLYRLTTEQAFYFNPTDMLRIVKSPIPGSGTATSFLRWIQQLFKPWETLETGPNKGRNKLWNETLKQSPVVRQFVRMLDPEQQKKALDLVF